MKSKYTIDLHMHSMLSDGKATPVQVVDKAYEVGLKKICLTDHNCVHENYGKLREYAVRRGVDLLSFSGCEASVVYYDGDRPAYTFHMLVYGEDAAMRSEKFQSLFTDVFAKSDKFAAGCVDALVSRGIGVSHDELFVLDPDIAPCVKRDKLCEDYIIKTVSAKLGITIGELYDNNVEVFYRAPLGTRERLLEILRFPDASGVIETANELGLVTVMAHPTWCDPVFECDAGTRTHGHIEALIRKLNALGLDGVEISHEIVERDGGEEMLRSLADELGLITTGGSDYHAEEEYGAHLTEYGTSEDELNALIKRLEEKRVGASA